MDLLLVEQLINGITNGALYALFASGLALIFGVLHILTMVHGSVYMFGAFSTWYIMFYLNWSFGVAIIIAAVITGLLGILLNFIAFKPLRNRNGGEMTALLSSSAASIIIVALMEHIFGTGVQRLPIEILPVSDSLHIGPISVPKMQLLILSVSLILMTALWLLVTRTQLGRSIRAVEENPKTAKLLGINVERVIMLTFFISSAVAGVAGGLLGVGYNVISPYQGQPLEMIGFAIIVLGGMGSIPGAVVGGLILGVTETLVITYGQPEFQEFVTYTLLFLAIIFRPYGIFGSSREVRA
jgi:branched-chain amino acid transport system permease protein